MNKPEILSDERIQELIDVDQVVRGARVEQARREVKERNAQQYNRDSLR